MDRRHWLKQIGLGLAGVGLANVQTFSAPLITQFMDGSDREGQPVLLRANENPYGPSPLARKVFAESGNRSNRYNWDIASRLIADLAVKNNLSAENILIGAGSTELLDLVAKFVASDKGNYVIADPSYDYWTSTLDNLGLQKIKVALRSDKKMDLPAMLKVINKDTKLVYICNPNNPTGTTCPREELLDFVRKVALSTIVLIDEAYLEFTREPSFSKFVNDFPNVIIVKTFSKIYGLAGARIGYALAEKTRIAQLNQFRSSPDNSVSVLSKLAAIASLSDTKFVSDCYALNQSVRKYTIEELRKLNCTCIESDTNFIYFSLEAYKKDYFQLLKDHNIEGTRIYEEHGKWTRITIGTRVEMQQFIKAIS